MSAIHSYDIEYPIIYHELVQIVHKNRYFYRASQFQLVSFSASISVMDDYVNMLNTENTWHRDSCWCR